MWNGNAEAKAACDSYLAAFEDREASKKASAALVSLLEQCNNCGCECDALVKEILADNDCLAKKSIWIFGGDGWAYDIGYGGDNHLVAMPGGVNRLLVGNGA